MRTLVVLIVTGLMLGDGLVALIAAYKLWAAKVAGSKPLAVLFAALAVHLALLTAAFQELPKPRPAEFGVFVLISLSVLAAALWPVTLHLIFSARTFLGSLTLRILDALPDAVVVTDFSDDGTILFVNRQMENLSGYSREDLINQPVDILVPERLREAHRAKRQEYRRRPSSRMMGTGIFPLRTQSGVEKPTTISLNSLDDNFVLVAIREVV